MAILKVLNSAGLQPPPAPGQHTHTPKAKGISLVLFFSALFLSLL
jgi:hypothetical protein